MGGRLARGRETEVSAAGPPRPSCEASSARKAPFAKKQSWALRPRGVGRLVFSLAISCCALGLSLALVPHPGLCVLLPSIDTGAFLHSPVGDSASLSSPRCFAERELGRPGERRFTRGGCGRGAANSTAARALSQSPQNTEASKSEERFAAAPLARGVIETAKAMVASEMERVKAEAGDQRLAVLTSPRGFCEGVRRAVDTVEEALRVYGAPVYVKHQIVHNEHVCKDLEVRATSAAASDRSVSLRDPACLALKITFADVVGLVQSRGAVFVESLQDVPRGAVVVFSAHGVPPALREEAASRELRTVDATCPLVQKVHVYVQQKAREGYHIVIIGHKNHGAPQTASQPARQPDSQTAIASGEVCCRFLSAL